MDAFLDDSDLLLDEGDMLVGCCHIQVDANGHKVFMEGFKLPIHEGMLYSETPVGIDGQHLLELLQNCGWLLVSKVMSSGELDVMTDGSQEGSTIDKEYVP